MLQVLQVIATLFAIVLVAVVLFFTIALGLLALTNSSESNERKEEKKMKGKRYILDIESLYQGEVVKRNTRVFETYKDLLYSVEKYIKNTYEFGKYVRYKEGNKEIVIVSDIWDYTGLILKFEGEERK